MKPGFFSDFIICPSLNDSALLTRFSQDPPDAPSSPVTPHVVLSSHHSDGLVPAAAFPVFSLQFFLFSHWPPRHHTYP